MEALSLLSQTLNLPHAQIAPRALSIDPNAADADLSTIAKRLIAVSEYSRWALASALATILKRKGERWLNEFCSNSGINPKLRRELLAVHAFYPPAQRTIPVTYYHYRDAMLIVSDGKPKPLQRALGCLALASTHHWSVSELRKHARGATATDKATPKQDEFVSYRAVHDVARYARHELPSLASWTKERIDVVLDDLSDSIELVDRLRELKRLKGISKT